MKHLYKHNYFNRLRGIIALLLLSTFSAVGQPTPPPPTGNFCGMEAGYTEEELRGLPWADNNQYLVDYLRDHSVAVPADYIDQIHLAAQYARQGYEPRTLAPEEVAQIDAEGRSFTPGMQYIPIKAWIHQRSDGTGGRSTAFVQQDIADLNAEFARSNVPITFYLKCAIGYVPDSYLYDRPDAGALDYMWRTWFDAAAVNVHFVNEPGQSSAIGGSEWAGIARLPNYVNPKFLLTLSRSITPSVFAHEIGHALGLQHTHNARDQGKKVLYNTQSGDCYQEPFSRTRRQEAKCFSTWGYKKAEVNGDALVDTPGDPGLYTTGSQIGYSFTTGRYEYTGGLNDRWGDAWRPDVYNMMSYGISRLFTPLQAGTMMYFASFLNTPGAALTISGPTTVCVGTNNPFSIISPPAASYTWTIPPGWNLAGQGTASVVITAPSGTAAGIYTIVARPDCNYAFATYEVRVGALPTSINGPDFVCQGTATLFSVFNIGGATYRWTTLPGWTTSSLTASSIRMTAGPNAVAGQISVAITLCGTSKTVTKVVDFNDPIDCQNNCRCPDPARTAQTVGTEGSSTQWQIEAVPNPASNLLTIRASAPGSVTAALLDSFGRSTRVLNWTGPEPLKMSLSGLPPGLYLLQVSDGQHKSTKRIQVQ